jgi:hypothetical protein
MTREELAAIEPHRAAACVMDDLGAQRRQWARENRRPRLSAREALDAVHHSALVLWLVWCDAIAGKELGDADTDAVRQAMQTIEQVYWEGAH